MKVITLVRHTDNRITLDANKIQNDYPLTPTGEVQAKELAKFLKKYTFDAIFTSLYKRSVQTAEIINRDKKFPLYKTNSFNEYFLREDGTGVEGTKIGIARTMTKIYSMFDIFENILIVAHSSTNKTILHALTNLKEQTVDKYFNKYGETHILRYDHKLGDDKWKIMDSFIPKQ